MAKKKTTKPDGSTYINLGMELPKRPIKPKEITTKPKKNKK